MRKHIAWIATIAIAASPLIVVADAQAWSTTCSSVNLCQGVKAACRLLGGSYGGYVDPWNGKIWGICVVDAN